MGTAIGVMESGREMQPHELLARGPGRLIVRVNSISYQGDGLNEYELVDPDGRDLPAFTAGSHVDLYFRDGRVRQYSLCNSSREHYRYKIVVQREAGGRGGSKAIFERVHVGRLLVISLPRNNFPLRAAKRHLLVGGGIGITPLMSMLYALDAEGQEFELHYCTRSPSSTAFLRELQPFIESGRAFLRHDGGDPTKGISLATLFACYTEGTNVYYCGPPGFMRAVAAAAAHWPPGACHHESFSTAGQDFGGVRRASGTAEMLDEAISVGFQIRIASTGMLIEVPNDKSILEVLREQGIDVPTSCEAGLCGTCKVRYVRGVPDHRDYILEDDEKKEVLLVCCSRSLSPELVLDL
jgi:vanillate O-demethylase ferredoxin subunit